MQRVERRSLHLLSVWASVKSNKEGAQVREKEGKARTKIRGGETERRRGGETEFKSEAECSYGKAESNQRARRWREAWHSSPTKGDSAINSINPISIPSSSPHWVNTHLHHTTKLLLPSYICRGRAAPGEDGWTNRRPDGAPPSARTPVVTASCF